MTDVVNHPYYAEVMRRLDALVRQHRDKLKRRVISRNMVFREYLGTQQLCTPERTQEVLDESAEAGCTAVELLDELTQIIIQQECYTLSGVSAALTRIPGPNGLRSVLVFAYSDAAS